MISYPLIVVHFMDVVRTDKTNTEIERLSEQATSIMLSQAFASYGNFKTSGNNHERSLDDGHLMLLTSISNVNNDEPPPEQLIQNTFGAQNVEIIPPMDGEALGEPSQILGFCIKGTPDIRAEDEHSFMAAQRPWQTPTRRLQ